ncbi:hypothetical protein LTR56_018975 [Elasticomyces elasticus]|nr:hypothetical protein LTR56_018975 [Elasticomyces elasticus]KAK3635557.1 hypothetical protein LTR22_019125 [Elasticomyces elasticus]KAK4911740.1 hypothetical protein LTR49_019730 [Elasticomyces elasticus]KAK5769777.1 hypothetical protein LTS12_000227 [Elasticomyces elasticus]
MRVGPRGNTEGVIYYVKTSTPHEYDISTSGPYQDVMDAYEQMLVNFGEECAPGQEYVQKIAEGGAGFEHVISPIGGHPNKTRKVELIRETNPAMAARLPGPAWCIIVAQVATVAMDGPAARHTVPLKDMQIRGTFGSEAAAGAAARTIAQRLADDVGGKMVAKPNGELGFGVIGSFEAMDILHMIEVRTADV